MIPDVPSVLTELSQLLMRNAVPGVPDAERASALGLSAMLLGIAAEVWDGAAHNLVEENLAFRTALGEDGGDRDLHLSVLRGQNARLRAKLIQVQTAAEEAGDTATQDRIWDVLRASTERRKLSISVV
jgi:hypothetical protein